MPTGETFKQLRPYHIRLKEYKCERGMESQVLTQIGSSYNDVGMVFDWRAHVRGIGGFELGGGKDILYGILYVCKDTQWGLDILISAEWADEKESDVYVWTHPLRPRNDGMGWDVEGL